MAFPLVNAEVGEVAEAGGETGVVEDINIDAGKSFGVGPKDKRRNIFDGVDHREAGVGVDDAEECKDVDEVKLGDPLSAEFELSEKVSDFPLYPFPDVGDPGVIEEFVQHWRQFSVNHNAVQLNEDGKLDAVDIHEDLDDIEFENEVGVVVLSLAIKAAKIMIFWVEAHAVKEKIHVGVGHVGDVGVINGTVSSSEDATGLTVIAKGLIFRQLIQSVFFSQILAFLL